MSDVEFAREQMIEQQLRVWEVFDPRVLCAFDEVPREEFVPDRFRGLAFADTEIPLGHGEVMMAPKIEGRMLQALTIGPTDRVLEVGTGSGWVTALLATLAAEVTSIEIVEEFAVAARQKLASTGILNVTVESGDASVLDDDRGYDAIALTGAMPVYDPRFESMLNLGGRLFVVTGTAPVMEARLVVRGPDGGIAVESLFETVLTPLRNFPQPTRFAL